MNGTKLFLKIFTMVLPCLEIFSACSKPIDLKREEQALISSDFEFARKTAEEGAEGWTAFFSPEGVMMPDGAPDVVGRQAILKTMARAFSQADYALSWQPKFADLASSGDLGYTVGSYTASYRNENGDVVRSEGRYVTIWKKDAQGEWKVALDIGNSTTPNKTALTQ